MKRISIYNSFISNNPTKRELLIQKLKQSGLQTGAGGDILAVIGGDGTFFSAVRKRMDENPIFVGFNAGNLGFLSEFTIENVDEFIRILKRGEYTVEHLPVYQVTYEEDGATKTEYFMNDLVIKGEKNTLHMGVHVNEEHVCSLSGDGIILSTPLGSTGYNMSAGGAISMGNNPFFQLTPIAPLNNKSYRSIPNSMIFPDHHEMTVFPNVKKQRNYWVLCDGREVSMKGRARFFDVKKSDKTIRMFRSKKYNSIHHIKNKIIDIE